VLSPIEICAAGGTTAYKGTYCPQRIGRARRVGTRRNDGAHRSNAPYLERLQVIGHSFVIRISDSGIGERNNCDSCSITSMSMSIK
jgi:hypothetical protein